jgi:hypothetical protein
VKRHWTNEELAEHWTLSAKELDLIGDSKTDHNLLGAVCLLKTSSMRDGFLPTSKTFPLSRPRIWPSSWVSSRRRLFLTTGKDAPSRRIEQPSARFWAFARPPSLMKRQCKAQLPPCYSEWKHLRQETALASSNIAILPPWCHQCMN